MSSMTWSADARIPVSTATSDPTAASDAAILLPEGATPPAGAAVGFVASGPAHAAGCVCCAARAPAALALDRLFQARARGTVPWFDRVVVAPGLAAAARDAARTDQLVAARYRFID